MSTRAATIAVVIFSAASASTGGPVKLLFGLLIYGAFSYIVLLSQGQVMLARARGEVDLLPISTMVLTVIAIGLPNVVAAVTKINPSNAAKMSMGAGCGMAISAGALWLWVKLKRRHSGRVYWPASWPNPWVRLTAVVVTILCSTLALAHTAVGQVLTNLWDWISDV